MFIVCLIFAIIIPYLICSINPAIIVVKIKTGRDIREMGSGNPGLTNALRTQGKAVAGLVLLLDVGKGALSILLTWLFVKLIAGGFDNLEIVGAKNIITWTAALFSVIGHVYPIYYKFKGGKAVLVTVAVLLVIDPLSAVILLSLFASIVALTKYVSLASLIAGTCYPICVYLIGRFVLHRDFIIIDALFASAIALILIFKHKANIIRLINKTEKKISFKKAGKDNG